MRNVMLCHVKGGYADYLSDTTRFFNKLLFSNGLRLNSELATNGSWT